MLLQLCVFLEVDAQLVVTNASPYDDQNHLVQEVLLGTGVTAFNIQFNGAAVPVGGIPSNAIGFFDNTNANVLGIGIDSGIVMTSGTIQNAVGPNLAGGTTGANGLTGDADLTALGGDPTFDACILEFDFVPSTDTVQFKYAFGSEEYPEYVGGSVNDVFGFFLAGPGLTGPYTAPAAYPNGSINIALIPGTTTPVSINDVNNVSNSQYYVSNGASGNGAGNATANPDVQYDGFTSVLTAMAVVIPCDTYHIKLAIADGGDGILDSGVFLEAKSFTSGQVTVSAQPSYNTFGTDTNLYEGCGSVSLAFQRYQDIQNPHTVYFDILGQAINGTDYSFIADSIVFPAGQSTSALTFTVFEDFLVETPESFIIKIHPDPNAPWCIAGDTVVATLYINDRPQVNVIPQNDTLTCVDLFATLYANEISGIQPFHYLWSTGDTTDSIILNAPSVDTTILVTITDACGHDTVYPVADIILFSPPLVASVVDDTMDCTEDSILIGPILISSSAPTFLWDNGSTDSAIWVDPVVDTTYYITVTDTCDTGAIFVDSIHVFQFSPPIISIASYDTIGCSEDSIQIGVVVTDATQPFYNWVGIASTDSAIWITPPTGLDTIYVVEIGDSCNGSTVFDTVYLHKLSPQVSLNMSDTTVLCPGDSITLICNTQGGTAPYTYNWNTTSDSCSIVVAPSDSTTYTLTVVDACGSTDIATVSVNVPEYSPVNALIRDTTVVCAGNSFSLLPDVDGGAGGYALTWVFNGDTIVSDSGTSLALLGTTNVTLIATDVCGNADTSIATVTIPVYDSILVSALAVTICTGDPVDLIATAVGGKPGSAYFYTWTGEGTITQSGDTALVVPPASGFYTVEVTDDCGNIGSGEMEVILEPCNLGFPNIITPNGDGFNEFFIIENLERFPGVEFKVYNRWGVKVYSDDNYRNNWDGNFLPDGTYFYILTVGDKVYQDHVTILR